MSNCKTSVTSLTTVERDPVFLSQKAKPGGVATLDANGKVPLSQIDIKAMFTERDPVYLADRGQPFGCATLDGSALVLKNQLGVGAANAGTFLRGDGVWAPAGGGGSGDIKSDGTVAFAANESMGGFKLINVGTPTVGTDAANKDYADNASGWKLTGTDISLVTSISKVVVGALPTIAKFGVRGDVASDITAIIRAATGQIANVVEIQNSSGVALISVSAAGDAYVAGKLTVVGAIDPTSILLSGGTALYYESNDGSTAPLSSANTGRIRYNNTTGKWQSSTQAGAYVNMVSGSGNPFKMVKWISSTETADGPVESDAGNTFLAPNVDNFLPLGTSASRFLSVSASNVLGIFLSQGDTERASALKFDRLLFGIGSTNTPDVSLRRNAVSAFAINDNSTGGDVTIGAVNNALFIDSQNGSAAGVSGATTGRLRYNNTTKYWEQSTKGNPYVPVGDVHDIFRYSMIHNLA